MVLRESITFLSAVEIHQIMVVQASALGPHTWNFLPENIKCITSIITFKDFIKSWLGPKCKCKLCL